VGDRVDGPSDPPRPLTAKELRRGLDAKDPAVIAAAQEAARRMQMAAPTELFREVSATVRRLVAQPQPQPQLLPSSEQMAEWEIEKHAIAYERALRRVASDTAPDASDGKDRGGRPTRGVMAAEDARKLEMALDLILRNGHDPNLTELAGRFGVSRDRIRQALTMRDRGVSLHDPARGSRQLATVLDSSGNVHWPSMRKLRKS
jgi:hypothetical protein